MLELSSLPKTWILDVDGTIVKHNGYLTDGYDTLLNGVSDFFQKLAPNDKVILITSRKNEYIDDLELFLKDNNIRYDCIIPNMPTGERILINDIKPSGLVCSYAINKIRDEELNIQYKINKEK